MVEGTDREHDLGCQCDACNKVNYKAIGSSLIALTPKRLQALQDLILEKNDDAFGAWLNEQESQGTFYGPNEQASVSCALGSAQGH